MATSASFSGCVVFVTLKRLTLALSQLSEMLVGFLGGFVICMIASGAQAAGLPANPYRGIVERNVFHLIPLAPPPAPQASKPPPPKIFLTGITTLLGNRRALLKTAPLVKAGELPKERYYLLTEGERQDDLEVLAINEKAGTARVSYAGTEISVSFKDNAVASTAPPAPVPAPPGVHGADPTQAQPEVNPAFRVPTPPNLVRLNQPAPTQPQTAANGDGNGRRPGYDEHGL